MTMKIQTLIHVSLTSIALAVTCGAAVVFAQQSSSNTYQINEVFFGTGGELNACSGNQYCAKQSAGELTVGNTKGNLFQAQAGFNTDRTPWIEVEVTKAVVNLGTVTATSTGFDYAAFTVKAYLTDGYVVQVYGPTPTNSGRAIAAPSTATPSTAGTEQFGMNLTDNTTPNIGANPVQRPDSTFSFGVANSNVGTDEVYNSPDNFKYESGDVIALSQTSSGFTDYTISYIMNISDITPGGTYATGQAIVATGTF